MTAPMAGANYLTVFNVTSLLDAPPKGRQMPWWGQVLSDLTASP